MLEESGVYASSVRRVCLNDGPSFLRVCRNDMLYVSVMVLLYVSVMVCPSLVSCM